MSKEPSCRFVRFAPGMGLRVLVEDGEPPPASPAVARRWEEMKLAIPRLYDAPILSVVAIDQGIIRCRRETYKRLVVQPRVATGVEQLSVTGILMARDERGERCVLLGQRSGETRMYAGMWELGPAGGVEAPPPGVRELNHEALAAELVREVREESGLDVAGRSAEAIGIVHDPVAQSYDVALLMDLGPVPLVSPRGWEYERVRWVGLGEIARLLKREREPIIAPSRLLLAALLEHWGSTQSSQR